MKNKTPNKNQILLILVLLISGSLLLYFFNINKGLWWDEAVYLGLAKNLLERKGYFINFNQETFRPPLFPVLISILWYFFGISENIVRFFIVIVSILSIFLTYLLTKEIFGKEEALWASLFLATSHMFLFYSLKILTESLFIFLSLLTVYTYYLGFEKNKKFFLFSGILMGLSFLTRYPGLILPVFYLTFPLFTKKRKIIFEKDFLLGLAIFIIILIPWFVLNQINFGSPVGALFVESSTVSGEYFGGAWNYYFLHWIEMFGLIGIFLVPGIIVILANLNKQKNIFIFLLFVYSLAFFMLIPRKELRYLMHYLPFYLIVFSIGTVKLRKWIGPKWVITGLAIFFVILNFLAGIQNILADSMGGYALKEAGFYLAKVTPQNSTIMSQNIPVLYYTSGRKIVYFPEKPEDLEPKIKELNVSYIVIEAREPSYPEYVWEFKDGEKQPSKIFENFTLEKTFGEKVMLENKKIVSKTFVWVYRV
jgi:4-amino-4-deoxy-L-arabinose transferase-like glycosyltransferase